MKKIYNKQTILYILLFLLIFILGILLIKYLASKKETFYTTRNPFTDGITDPEPFYVHDRAGPPNTFINCYNPTGITTPIATMNGWTPVLNIFSFSFIYHSTGPAASATGNYVCIFRMSSGSEFTAYSRCPALFIQPHSD